MKYMGSKAKITKFIVPIIQQKIEESGSRIYMEPFAGGCNVIDKVNAMYRVASDKNEYLIALFKYLQVGGGVAGKGNKGRIQRGKGRLQRRRRQIPAMVHRGGWFPCIIQRQIF